MPRVSRASALAALILIAGCADRPDPVSPGDPPPPTTSSARQVDDASARARHERLARLVAVAMRDEGFRAQIHDALRRSSQREGKVHLQALLGANGGRARAQLARANLVLLITDWSQDWKTEETALLQAVPEALVVHNKCDLPQSPGVRPGGLEISASTGAGIKQLVERIGKLLVPDPPPAGAAVPFTEVQISLLRQAAVAVSSGRLRDAAVAAKKMTR